MTPFLSAYLNLARFTAAMVVLASHFAYVRYTGGSYLFIRDLNLGSDAVVVFFVLSGLVISFSADQKDKSIGSFLFLRMTRLYSVAIPALIFTYILDQIGSKNYALAYEGWWFNDISIWKMLLSGLSFTNEWDLNIVRLGTNGPYWSLSYEFAYYIMFAFAYYLRGWKRAALIFFVVYITGPRIWVLYPVWLMGCLAYKIIKQDAPWSNFLVFICIFIPPLLYIAALINAIPVQVLAFCNDIFGTGFIKGYLRFSDEFIWNNFLGILTMVHFVGISKLKLARPRSTQLINWLSGATFSIYIMHYPLLQLINALTLSMPASIFRDVTLLLSTILVCFIFAQLFERPLSLFRRNTMRIYHLFPGKH